MNKVFIIFFTAFFASFYAQVSVQKNPYEGMYTDDQKAINEVWNKYLNSFQEGNEGDCSLWKKDKYLTEGRCNALSSQGYYNPSLFKLSFKNQVISIESVNSEQYKIVSQFYTINDGALQPFAITNVMAEKNNNMFLLSDYLTYATKDWKSHKIGRINYHYRTGYILNEEKAKQANVTIENLDKLFKLTIPNDIQYFLADNCRQVYTISGFDFAPSMNNVADCAFFDSKNNIIYTTVRNGENHKHELIHRINIQYPYAHYLLLSGLSIYSSQKNTHIGYSYSELFTKFNNYYNEHKNIKPALIDTPSFDKNISIDYLMGAIVIDAILEKGGIDLLIKSLDAIETDEDIYNFLEKNYKVKKEQIGDWILLRAQKMSGKDFKFKINM
ncbi:Uncharacterised protein [Chryseobacterium nakagawai]|uniref:Uncharacterized protein n=1 Tax=Chryseobacterium nakagawai TaxID=1241982 RepID=A0AAD1DRJ6_CHRNA|nr:hypothetical protein [Chryseobacterium nakagawai]AZA90964.1 hypothetical protein EG343_10115 [Chryseobacterium nakagawai]VEH22508.1 Uncharacterised protein [Chryseobacterium nakagawai]